MSLSFVAERLTLTVEAVRGLAGVLPALIASMVKKKQAQAVGVPQESSTRSQRHSALRELRRID